MNFCVNYFDFVFAPYLTYEKTGTPLLWQDDNEFHIQHSRRAGKSIRRYVQMTEVKDIVRVK